MQRIMSALRGMLPPILVPPLRSFRRALSRGPAEWKYIGSDWPSSDGKAGWLHPSVVQAQARKLPKVIEAASGNGPLGISHEAGAVTREDSAAHNTVMSFAYVLALAAQSREVVSVLDWGGGIGQYAVLAHALLPLSRLDYRVLELEAAARAGREMNPTVRFYDDPQQLGTERFELVFASGTLHSVRDWTSTLRLLACHSRRYVFVTRLPLVGKAASYVTLQRPHAVGYDTEYPAWVLNRDELLRTALLANLHLLREFIVVEHHVIPRAPEQPAYRGFLFEVR